jgi:hypothetical protein
MLGDDAAGISADLTERDSSHSGSFEPEAESADTGKEVEDIHWNLCRLIPSLRNSDQPDCHPLQRHSIGSDVPACQRVFAHHFQVFDRLAELESAERNSVPRIVVELVRTGEGRMKSHQNNPHATREHTNRNPRAPAMWSIYLPSALAIADCIADMTSG